MIIAQPHPYNRETRGRTRHQLSSLANTYVCCLLVVVVIWYVSRQAKVSDLEHVIFDDQHVTSGEVSVDTLRQRRWIDTQCSRSRLDTKCNVLNIAAHFSDKLQMQVNTFDHKDIFLYFLYHTFLKIPSFKYSCCDNTNSHYRS